MLTVVLRVWAARPGRPAAAARTRSQGCGLPQARRDALVALGQVGVLQTCPAGCSDRGDDRVDAAQCVGAAGRRVGVGRLPQRPAGEVDGAVAVEVGTPAELDDGAGVQAARPGGDVFALLVPTAGDVEVPQPAA